MLGVSINPTAFLVVQQNFVKLLPVNHSNTIDKILDYVPDLIEKANGAINKCIQNKQDLSEKIIDNMKKKCEEKANKDKESLQNDEENTNKVKTIKQEIEIEEEQE